MYNWNTYHQDNAKSCLFFKPQSHCHLLLRFKMLRFNYVLNQNVPLFWKLGFTRFVLRSYHVFLPISTCTPTFPPRSNKTSTRSYVFTRFLLRSNFRYGCFGIFKTSPVPFWTGYHYVFLRFYYASIRFVTYTLVSLRFQNVIKRSSWNVTVWLGLYLFDHDFCQS